MVSLFNIRKCFSKKLGNGYLGWTLGLGDAFPWKSKRMSGGFHGSKVSEAQNSPCVCLQKKKKRACDSHWTHSQAALHLLSHQEYLGLLSLIYSYCQGWHMDTENYWTRQRNCWSDTQNYLRIMQDADRSCRKGCEGWQFRGGEELYQ